LAFIRRKIESEALPVPKQSIVIPVSMQQEFQETKNIRGNIDISDYQIARLVYLCVWFEDVQYKYLIPGINQKGIFFCSWLYV
jgi:hypothetical protein